MKSVIYKPIGILNTSFEKLDDMPIQPGFTNDSHGTALIFPEFREGLKDLVGFSHIYLIYHLHMVSQHKMVVIPFLDKVPRGLFSTRAPLRPNPIGISVVRLHGIEDNILHLEGMDMLNGTPLLDIKPYISDFDCFPDSVNGWYGAAAKKASETRSDDRFCKKTS